MRLVKEPSPFLQVIAVFGSFFIGPWAGLQTSLYLVPDSDLVQTVSVLAFGLVFVGGTLLWAGFGIAWVVVTGLWRLVRGRAYRPSSLPESDRVVPPGYRIYLVLGAAGGLGVGMLAGAITDLSMMRAVTTWTVVGLAYGWLLWLAAHHGYLPFPEPE